jgi:N-acetylglucosaminyl-diphospho-decaprenol L-rhamnosyltransferase
MFASLSIIIPSFNSLRTLQKTLASLLEHVPNAEIIVVDGGSTDGSQEWLTQLDTVRLLRVTNHGYGHALNRGCEIAKNPILVLMNSDVLIEKNALLLMQQRLLEQHKVAAVGVVPLQTNGTRQRSFGPLALYWSNYFPVTKAMRVKMLHGYCIATRRDVLEHVGGFDENFFFYNEEYDWCWRVLKTGLFLEILPETAIHFGGSSTTGSPEILFEGMRGGMYVVDKHFPRIIVGLTRRLFQLIAWSMCFLEKRPEYKKAWQHLDSCMKRGDYLETPFPLSGRGVVHFEPKPKITPPRGSVTLQ